MNPRELIGDSIAYVAGRSLDAGERLFELSDWLYDLSLRVDPEAVTLEWLQRKAEKLRRKER